MVVNEIFKSIQGESTLAGFPTVFVRFTGCNLRCSYCDTAYAYSEGLEFTPAEVYNKINSYNCMRVCLTGGEPLLQGDLKELMYMLYNYTVSIETNGSIQIKNLKEEFRKERNEKKYDIRFIMDIKCPSSGYAHEMVYENLYYLDEKDEIKLVVANKTDYEWGKNVLKEHYQKGIVNISPVFGVLSADELAEWIISDGLDYRLQLQLHKIIWGTEARGV